MSKLNNVFWGAPKKKLDKEEEKVDNTVNNETFNPDCRTYAYAINKQTGLYNIFVIDLDSVSLESKVTEVIETKFDTEYRIIAEVSKLKVEDSKRKK